MLMSAIAWILLGVIAGFVASNIVRGRVERAKGHAVTSDIKQAGVIPRTNTVTPTGMTRVARRNVTQRRDLTNTWSQL
ncbi:MAG: hypothetical protein ABR964_01185 [Tepidisphaeraceae bacterium]|jgi:hypothetical protein